LPAFLIHFFFPFSHLRLSRAFFLHF
jgi:hypothetical protein